MIFKQPSPSLVSVGFCDVQPSPPLMSVGFCDIFMLTKDENKISQNNDERRIATSIL